MPHPEVAIVIGSPADHPVREEVEHLAKGSGFEFLERTTCQDVADLLAAEPHLGSGRTLMLLCSQCVVHDSLPNAARVLKAQRPGSGRIVVYAQDQWSGGVALECIQAGAYDYLVPDYNLAELARHITYAFKGESAYAVYKGVTGLVPGDKVFIAMPYDRYGYQHFDLGASVALRRLDLQPILASDEVGPDSLRTKVYRQIDESKLVIADISQYGRKGVNPNVTDEAQHARGRGIPVLLIRCLAPSKGGRKPVPSNLLDLERLEFHTCADLALKLYFGLRPCMGTP